ncbi:IS3 family transposase [Geomicrobium sp. JSM 1781026]|uniref:IS3 family transposase n=1 Tax=Geomicrobium sp. JSM 1781026 TaxID=3344580 RepID=UPI0035C04B50
MAKSKFNAEAKYEVIQAIEEGDSTIKEVTEQYGVSVATFKRWRRKYEHFGLEGLQPAKGQKTYTKEIKRQAVHEVLSEHYSLTEIAIRYAISDQSVLRKWIQQYNGQKDVKSTGKRVNRPMTKGRATTHEERIFIAKDCIESDKDYQMIAEHYNVSYQQVYQWTKKHEEGGEDALRDRRGRTKTEGEITPQEKTELQTNKLKRENERLRAEKCALKKVEADRKEAKISEVRSGDIYLAIQELHQSEHFSISLLCEVAGRARSAYHKWKTRKPSANEQLNQTILDEMSKLHEDVKGIYGYRRMTMNMRRVFEMPLNEKRIYRLMGLTGMQSVIRRKKKRYVKSNPQHVAENVLNREFKADHPNEKWVTDVTELKYGSSQKAYLSAIRDLYDGSIVSYVLSRANNNRLVFETLNQATESSPAAKPLLHSDRGFQYTSHGFKRLLQEAKIKPSMSRVGRCIDNGPMESFWGTLKCEKYRLHKFQTFDELKQAIDDYIYFYNCERLQKRLNGLTPMEYRNKAA